MWAAKAKIVEEERNLRADFLGVMEENEVYEVEEEEEVEESSRERHRERSALRADARVGR